jgi:hypothetical protein
MNPTRNCPRCARVIQAAHSFCPACGANLKPPGGGHGWKLLVGALLLFAGVLWATAIYTQTSRPPLRPQLLAGAAATPPPTTQSADLTSAQHLAAARKALADGYRPHKDPKKASWGEVGAARWHLKEIGPAAPEYREAQELLKEVTRRERQSGLASGAKTPPAPSPTPKEDVDVAERPSTAAPAAPTRPPAVGRAATAGENKRAGSGSSSDDYYTNVEGVRVRRPTFSESVPAGASAQCRDGSYSFSRNRRGTCSHHGGVARWL